MLWIEVPEKVLVTDLKDEPVLNDQRQPQFIDMYDFLFGRLGDQKWGQNWQWGDAQSQIKDAVKTAKETGAKYIAAETADWEKLKDVVENPHPSTNYNAAIMHNLITFRRAVINAHRKKPDDFVEGEAAEAN